MPGVQRQLPQWREVARFVAPALRRRTGPRSARAQSVADLQRMARRRTPRAVYDYVAGAAEDERSLAASTAAFDRVVLRPRVLRDVTTVDPATTILGRPAALPLVLGPTGFTRMMHTAGEPAVARAAGRAGVPYALSTLGTTSLPALAEAAPDTERWFQLYLWRDRGRSRELLDEAWETGCTTVVVTVDVPVAGARLRDSRNGLTLPPSLSLTTLLDMARRPRWLVDSLTTAPLRFEALGKGEDVISLINAVFDPAVTFDDVAWLRSTWRGSLVVKGIVRGDDATEAVAAGADGIAVSNHGGRQLDRALSPLEALPEVVGAVGDRAEVYLDGGVRSGADIAIAVALGAQAAFVARPYLYALMADGEDGVDRLMQLLAADYVRTLQLLGVTRTADLDPDLIVPSPR